MQLIPIKAVPNQTVTVGLGGQACQINIRQTLYGLVVDLYVSNVLVLAGALALDRNRIVRDGYLGFSGDLTFIDTQGTSDPTSTGLGARFRLAYLLPNELVAL